MVSHQMPGVEEKERHFGAPTSAVVKYCNKYNCGCCDEDAPVDDLKQEMNEWHSDYCHDEISHIP